MLAVPVPPVFILLILNIALLTTVPAENALEIFGAANSALFSFAPSFNKLKATIDELLDEGVLFDSMVSTHPAGVAPGLSPITRVLMLVALLFLERLI